MHAGTDWTDKSARWAFVVGAPRCGTTAITKWLRTHPDVCRSIPKEPHFFAMHDLRGHPTDELRRIVQARYIDRFFPETGEASLLAEGSVSYLYAPERLEPILQLWPKAKFIICVRNPLQMVPSLHQRHFVNGDETVRKFERAWALVPDRRNGRSIPRSCLDPRFLDYWEAGLLGKHVSKFFEAIGRERCLVIVFDDLVADPARAYRRVLRFLDLPDDEKVSFDRYAESKDLRVPWLQRLLQRPPRIAVRFLDEDDLHNPRFSEKAGPLLNKIIDVRSAIIDWNEIPAQRTTVDPAVVEEMAATYQKDVALLSRLLDRDLSHWLDVGLKSQAANAERDAQMLADENR